MSIKKKAPVKKCVVKTCTNKSDQGQFIGNFCFPCWDAITDPDRSGTKHSTIYRQMVRYSTMATFGTLVKALAEQYD